MRTASLEEKNKLQKELILDKLKDIHKEIDINEHKVENFLLIFHTSMETVNSEEVLEYTDSVVTDTILKIVLKLSELLKNNIDSLKLPEIFKIALRKIKNLFNLQTDQNATHTGETEETKASGTSWNGSQEYRECSSEE